MTAKNNLLFKNEVVNQTFVNGETGEQREILVPNKHIVTINIIGGASDDIDLKCRFKENGISHTIFSGISNDFNPINIVSKPYSIFIVINTNVSNNIIVEAVSFEGIK